MSENEISDEDIKKTIQSSKCDCGKQATSALGIITDGKMPCFCNECMEKRNKKLNLRYVRSPTPNPPETEEKE